MWPYLVAIAATIQWASSSLLHLRWLRARANDEKWLAEKESWAQRGIKGGNGGGTKKGQMWRRCRYVQLKRNEVVIWVGHVYVDGIS